MSLYGSMDSELGSRSGQAGVREACEITYMLLCKKDGIGVNCRQCGEADYKFGTRPKSDPVLSSPFLERHLQRDNSIPTP